MVYPSWHMYTELFNPLYGTVDGLPVIVVGAVSSVERVDEYQGPTAIEWVAIDDDGKLRTVSLSSFVVDTRFRDGGWRDVSPGATGATSEEG